VARGADLDLAIALAEDADAPRAWYGLGQTPPGRIRLIVVRGEARLDSLMRGRGPAWGAGFAMPGARTIVIRADKGDPRQTLRHELAHFALHDAVRVRVPLWFDEGYAAIAAGEWDRLDGLRLNLTVARGRIPNFYELDRALRAGESTAEAAYALAASAVAMVARRHPGHSLDPLLTRLKGGESFESALLATTGSTVGRFEVEWQKDVRKRYGLLVWAMAGGLWLLVALGVILASWLRRRRDRPRRAALDQGWVIEPEDPEAPEEGPSRLDSSPPAP
jgi:peptidase MA superfamily protein